MKKIFLSTLLLIFCQSIFAQYTTIKTPTNVSVEALNYTEYSDPVLDYIEQQAADWIDNHDSNAERVAPASHTYNCHSYAWHYSDGGTKRWVDQKDQYENPNISKYWSGSSPTYQQVVYQASTRANKVFYPNGDHSAKVISPDLFESKWGNWPRYRHYPSDCPYNSSNLQYYYIPIYGNTPFCTSETFTTLNISNASYNWSGSKISINGNGSSVTAVKELDGSGWIKTKISSTYSGTTIKTEKKFIWLGKPDISEAEIVGEYCGHPSPFPCIYYYGERYGVRIEGTMYGVNQGYEWSGMAQDIHSYCGSTGASFIPNNLGPPHYGSGYIQVVGKNQCGDSYPVQTGYGPCQRATSSGEYYTLSPNPADESTEVSTKESTETRTQDGATTETFEPGQIKIYDKSGIVVRVIDYNTPRQRINTSSMDEGIYIVEISTPKHTEKLRLMVEH